MPTQYNKYTYDNNTHQTTTTIHTSTNNNYTKDNLKLATKHTKQIRILQHVQKVKTPTQDSTVYSFLLLFFFTIINSLTLSLLITYLSCKPFPLRLVPPSPSLYCTSLHLIPLHFASFTSLQFIALGYTPR